MENEQGKVSMASKQTGQERFQCTGDCLGCYPAQRAYCASQHAYQSMRMLQRMEEAMSVMAGTMEELKEKIGAIQGNEALVFDPYEHEAHEAEEEPAPADGGEEAVEPVRIETAQKGSSAENRLPRTRFKNTRL